MSASSSSSLALDRSANPLQLDDVVRISTPDAEAARPVIIASPHSGRDYDAAFCEMTKLPLDFLRRSEDAYVDDLIDTAVEFGASMVCALFPRVFVDVNRGRWELDPRMFSDRLPADVDGRSRRAASGLGVVPRIGADGRQLYRRPLRYAEAEARITRFYDPYHDALRGMIESLRERFGIAVVLDAHSMPDHSARGVDFVLGDRYGAACDPGVTATAERLLRDLGYVTVRNTPYAGGFTTEHYGQPESGVHVLQIEINRSLYLDEKRVVPSPEFDGFRQKMSNFIKGFSEVDWISALQP